MTVVSRLFNFDNGVSDVGTDGQVSAGTGCTATVISTDGVGTPLGCAHLSIPGSGGGAQFARINCNNSTTGWVSGDEFWYGAYIKLAAGYYAAHAGYTDIMRLDSNIATDGSSSGNLLRQYLTLNCFGSDAWNLQFYIFDSAGVGTGTTLASLGTGTAFLSEDAWHWIEFHVKLGTGGAGTTLTEMYVNGTLGASSTLQNYDTARNPYTRFRSGIGSADASSVNVETVYVDRVYTGATVLGPIAVAPSVTVTGPPARVEDRLSINLTHADGRITRLGPDETDAANIPQDLSFGTSIPGGFQDASLGLLRRIDTDWPDLGLFDNVRIVGPGGRVAWEGRQAQFPRSHGDSYSINPGAVGWSSHLRDDPSFTEIYVDRDLGQWGTPPLDRRTAVAASGISTGDFSWANENGGLIVALPNQSLGAQTMAEAYYQLPPGRLCASVMYIAASTTYPAWVAQLVAGATETAASETYSLLGGSVLTTQALTTHRRYLTFRAYSNGTTATPASGSNLRVTAAGVYGSHGLTLRTITGEPSGLYASDVIADVVSRAAPLLTYTTGAGGSIDATSFPIPHLVFRDPTTAEAAITDINKYHLYDWGVWENREFFFRQPDPDRLCWEARLGDGAHMQADGLTGEQVINGVIVTYTDATGATKTVGPPSGTAGSFDATSADLQDTSDGNPVNSHGIPAKPDNLVVPFPTNLAGAIQLGTVFLAERSLATRRGSLTLTGTVTHPTEGPVPLWRVRAGDWVRVTDADGASVQRKIIETRYQHSGSRSITLTLDNTSAKISGILARVGVQAGIQQGSGF